jgi:peptidoglycan/xylan/chitin deacetylase (PgdA/CDA1 family)
MPKHRRLIIVFGIIFVLLFSLVNFISRQYVVPILMYHSVAINPAPENRLAVSVASFERQMNFLKRHHYNVMPLETIAALLKSKKKIPPKTVAITFDDGYKNVYTYAFPILKKYNLPATLFIIVNEVGRPQADRLSWDEIKDMRNSGIISFGSHGLDGEPLVNLKSEEVKKQIFDSKKILEKKLDCNLNAFSYGEGMFNNLIKQLVINAGYKLAVATKPGKKFPNDDVFALKRLRISSTSDNLLVFWIETSGYYTFIREGRHKHK